MGGAMKREKNVLYSSPVIMETGRRRMTFVFLIFGVTGEEKW